MKQGLLNRGLSDELIAAMQQQMDNPSEAVNVDAEVLRELQEAEGMELERDFDQVPMNADLEVMQKEMDSASNVHRDDIFEAILAAEAEIDLKELDRPRPRSGVHPLPKRLTRQITLRPATREFEAPLLQQVAQSGPSAAPSEAQIPQRRRPMQGKQLGD